MSGSKTKTAREQLFARTHAGIKPGTEAITALLAELNNPQDTFLCVHIAGTNGKGSVAAQLESILRVAGIKTGLYTSPHLVEFNERFKFQGAPISDPFLEELIARVTAADDIAATRERPCTFFELSTAIAFAAFAELQVQVAVIETGLGGRWDATNIIHPLLSVITPISLDHTDLLGNTLSDIAAEKAGIIKEGRPVVIAPQAPRVAALLQEVADTLAAPCVLQQEAASVSRVSQTLDGQTIRLDTTQASYGTCRLGLLGDHQIGNAVTSVLAAEQVFQALGMELEPEAVKQGLSEAVWPGRMQVIERDPPIILDGAHNPAAAACLASTLEDLFPGTPGAFVVGFLDDKDSEGVWSALSPRAGRVFASASMSPRSRSPENVKKMLDAHCKIEAEVGTLLAAIEAARAWAREQGSYVCVTGSLFLVGEALALLGPEVEN